MRLVGSAAVWWVLGVGLVWGQGASIGAVASDPPAMPSVEEVERELAAMLGAGDADGMERCFEEWVGAPMYPHTLRDPYSRGLMVLEGLSRYPEVRGGLRAWLDRYPESAHIKTVVGKSLITAAWEVRGSGYANTVRPEAWETFYGMLREARGFLEEAAAAEGERTEALSALLTVSMGLQLPDAQAAAARMYPEGRWVRQEHRPLIDLTPSPAFELVAQASGAHAERVEDPDALPDALERAVRAVQGEERQALLNVIAS